MAGERLTRERVAQKRRTGCTVQLSWMGPPTFVAVPRKASAVVLFTAYPVGGFPRTLQIGPQPSHHEEQVLFWSKVLLLFLLLVPDLGPGRLIICGLWLHTRRRSICDLHITMASELRRHDPMFKEQQRPPLLITCKAICNVKHVLILEVGLMSELKGTWCLSKRPESQTAVKLSLPFKRAGTMA